VSFAVIKKTVRKFFVRIVRISPKLFRLKFFVRKVFQPKFFVDSVQCFELVLQMIDDWPNHVQTVAISIHQIGITEMEKSLYFHESVSCKYFINIGVEDPPSIIVNEVSFSAWCCQQAIHNEDNTEVCLQLLEYNSPVLISFLCSISFCLLHNSQNNVISQKAENRRALTLAGMFIVGPGCGMSVRTLRSADAEGSLQSVH